MISFDLTTMQIASSNPVDNDTRSFAFPGGYSDYLTISPIEGVLPANQEDEIVIEIDF